MGRESRTAASVADTLDVRNGAFGLQVAWGAIEPFGRGRDALTVRHTLWSAHHDVHLRLLVDVDRGRLCAGEAQLFISLLLLGHVVGLRGTSCS